MSLDITASIDALKSFVMTAGGFNDVQTGIPEQPPSDGLYGFLTLGNIEVGELELDAVTWVLVLNLRVVLNLDNEGSETEVRFANVMNALLEAMIGDSDLGGQIRAIDAGAIYGTGLDVEFDFLVTDDTAYRMADVTIPLIIDGDAGTLSS